MAEKHILQINFNELQRKCKWYGHTWDCALFKRVLEPLDWKVSGDLDVLNTDYKGLPKDWALNALHQNWGELLKGSWWNWNGDVRKEDFIHPGKKGRETTLRYYDKVVPFKDGQNYAMVVKDELGSVGYLWTDKKGDLDISETQKREPDILLCGLHTYGGYYGCFRPDLVEVFGLLADSKVDKSKLESCKAIYCTTVPWPNNSASCYDSHLDRQRALTKVWLSNQKPRKIIAPSVLNEKSIKSDKLELNAKSSKRQREEVKVEEEQDLGMCLICKEKPASTIVKPCNHCVACSKCSRLLEKTADKTICLRCHTKITNIEYYT